MIHQANVDEVNQIHKSEMRADLLSFATLEKTTEEIWFLINADTDSESLFLSKNHV